MCDGVHCLAKTGQVRLLPYGGDGNMILCRSCFNHEIRERERRNKEAKENLFDTPKWEDCKPYES